MTRPLSRPFSLLTCSMTRVSSFWIIGFMPRSTSPLRVHDLRELVLEIRLLDLFERHLDPPCVVGLEHERLPVERDEPPDGVAHAVRRRRPRPYSNAAADHSLEVIGLPQWAVYAWR